MRFLLLLLVAGCAGTQPTSAPPADDPLIAQFPGIDDAMPWDPGVRKGTLDNGLTWYVEQNPEPQERVELWMAVRVGSVHEDEDQQGLAHYVEHMAFNGTEHFPKNELIEYLESVGTRFGAHLNAHTSFEETVYKLQVPTDDPEILANGFQVLRDWAGGMSFDSEEMEKERGVVLEEWRRSRGAGGRSRDALIPLTFHGARHAERLPIGTKESLDTFELDAARRYYADWYRPDLMAVFVVGDVEPDAMQAEIAKWFGDLAGPESPRERVQYEIPVHEETLYGVHVDPEMPYSVVSVMAKGRELEGTTPRDYRDAYAWRLLTAVINERLGELGRDADAPFTRAGVGRGRMTPVAVSERAWAVAKEGRLEETLQTLLVEVERVRRHGVQPSEVDRAKANSLTNLAKSYQERENSPSRSVLSELLRNFTNGETVPGLDWEYHQGSAYIQSITPEEVNALSSRFLGTAGRVVTATLPQKEGVTPPSEDALAQVVGATAGLTIEPWQAQDVSGPVLTEAPTPGTIVSEAFDDATQTHEWTLSNGVLVLVKPTDFKTDEIRFHGYTEGGTSVAEDADYIPAATALAVSGASGFGRYDRQALDKWFAGKVIRDRAYVGAQRQGVRVTTRPDDLEDALAVAHARIVEPRFTQAGFDVTKAQWVEGARNRDASPDTVFGDTWTRLLMSDHPRSRPWTVERYEDMDLAKSEAFYRARMANWGGGTFAFVGAVDLEVLRPLVATYLASLPAGTPETWVDRGYDFADGRHEETVSRGLEPKARVRFRISGEFESSPDTRHQLRMLGKLLSMRLREVLREDLGGTYSTGARASDRFIPNQDYGVQVEFQCDPERVDELTKAAYGVIDEVLAAPSDPSYAQRIAEQERRSLESNLRDNGFWLGALTGNRQRGESRESLDYYWSLHEQITPEYLHAAAQRFLNLDNVIQVTLLPEASTDE